MRKHLITFLALSASHILFAEQLSKIQIVGNKRIEAQTIKSYLPVKEGESFSESTADLAVRELYNTGYFVDVKVVKKGSVLSIEVLENPIVNQIVYEGNDKLKDEQIEQEVGIRPRKILSKTDIQNAQQRILEMYRRLGRFNAKVDPKLIKLNNNRVNLVFEIQEGDVTNIEKITFIGNKTFSSTTLEEQMHSKRYKWWRFFASDDVFDADRFMADQQALRQYYMNNGHPDFRIASAVSELSADKREFYLTITLDEGDYYTFGTQKVVSQIKDVPTDVLMKEVTFSDGDMYSAKQIEKTVEAITDALGDKGYAFVSVEPVVDKDPQTKKANITFEIKEGPRVYIQKINIKGNDRTHDAVIRRELTIHEGDVYNASKIKHSESKIKDLDFFKAVSLDEEETNTPDKTNINISVEEQSTGSVKLNGGYSTLDGPLIGFGFNERNFMGKGQDLHADISLAKRNQEIDIGIVEPYLFNRKLRGSVDVFASRSGYSDSYKVKQIGFSYGLQYELTPNLIQGFTHSVHVDKMTDFEKEAQNQDPNALPRVSELLKNERRNVTISSLAHVLKYDKRDSVVETTRGYVLKMTNTYGGIGGNVQYIRNDFMGTAFYTPLESVLTFAQMDFGFVMKGGSRPLRLLDCVYLGGDSFKGFEYQGMGPRDLGCRNQDPVGGKKYWKLTLEAQFPIGLPADFGVKAAVFGQTGQLWDTIAKNKAGTKINIVEDKKVRASVGFGIIWKGPFGPLRIDYAIPIRKQKYDKVQRINLSYALPL
ncbi:MAG: Outer membrane protein assembly factor BamA [Holosporales bacterium]